MIAEFLLTPKVSIIESHMRYPKDRFAVDVLMCLWFMLAAVSAHTAEAGRASGQFESKEIHLKITDAYAFRGTPALGGKEKVIVGERRTDSQIVAVRGTARKVGGN